MIYSYYQFFLLSLLYRVGHAGDSGDGNNGNYLGQPWDHRQILSNTTSVHRTYGAMRDIAFTQVFDILRFTQCVDISADSMAVIRTPAGDIVVGPNRSMTFDDEKWTACLEEQYLDDVVFTSDYNLPRDGETIINEDWITINATLSHLEIGVR